MAARLHREPRLVLRFAMYAGVAFVLTLALHVVLLRHNAVERAERSVLADTHFIADRLGKDDIVRDAFRWPRPEGVQGEDLLLFLDDLLNREVVAPDVVRITLFAPDGRITYSNDHGLIGGTARDQERVRAAVDGRDFVSIGRLQTPAGEGAEVIQAYTPVYWLFEPGTPRGVLAIARAYEPIAADVRQDVLLQAGGITLALLLLYLALLPIMRRVTRTLEERNRRLAEQAGELRALMEQASDGIFVCDQEGRLLAVNPTLCRLLGRAEDELVGASAAELVEPAQLDAVPLRLGEVLAGEAVLQERRLLHADGSVVVAEFHSTLLDDGRIYVGVRDISERKRVEHELREAYRAEALGRLASGVAADFGKLMFDVARESVDLRERLSQDAALLAHVDSIVAAAQQGASLTRQLRDFASVPAGEPEELDLNEVVGSVEAALRLVVGDGVQVVVERGEDLPRVRVDRAMMERLVIDLAMNARNAAQGGRLAISTANVDFTRRGDGRGKLDTGRYAMLTVSRTGGEGSADAGDRMALGLAAVFALVQPSGGTIGVETEPGYGTTIRVYLPAADRRAASASAVA